MADNQTTVRSFRPRRISWLTIVLALLAVVSFVAISRPNVRYDVIPMGTPGMMENYDSSGALPPTQTGAPMMDNGVSSAPSQGKGGSDMYYPYPYPSPDVPVTDTREFLKVYYNASMRTRDVSVLTRRVETTVRGYSGRIDHESSSPQYGYVSFAVPQSKYDAFRAELESLVASRFLTVNISSQNLLPQKVSIEEQQKQADTALSDYKTARQKIVSAHARIVQFLQSKKDADRNIKYAEDWIKAVQTQDQTLLDNVATVTGTVSIAWISLWDCARLYLPGYWIPFIFAALACLSFLFDRRRYGTV